MAHIKKFYSDLHRLAQLRLSTVILLAIVSSVASLIYMSIVAVVADSLHSNPGQRQLSHMALFFTGAVVVWMVLQRISARYTVRLIERASAQLREVVLDSIFHFSTGDNENVGHHRKRSLIARDVHASCAGIRSLIVLPAQISTAIGGLLYMFYLSRAVALLSVGITVITLLIIERVKRKANSQLKQAHEAMDHCLSFADDLFHGHKELKLDATAASEFLRDDLFAANQRTELLLAQARMGQSEPALITAFLGSLLLGAIAFYLRPYLGLSDAVITSSIMVLVYFQSAAAGVVQTTSTLDNAGVSLNLIVNFLATHEHSGERGWPNERGNLDTDWRTIRLEKVGYRYPAAPVDAPFQLKNINLTIDRGSIVFIVGANGSGKTTLAKILLGLYQPVAGDISLDQTRISQSNLLGYRSLFNAVFSDVHLFRRHVHGVFRQAEAGIRNALERMKIPLHISADSRVNTRPYSQGQRKRLASAFALANDKPICLFDEWTADQDPEFRHYFYSEFLPKMKAAGKTLLVITHDESQFRLADQIINLEAGQLVETGYVALENAGLMAAGDGVHT